MKTLRVEMVYFKGMQTTITMFEWPNFQTEWVPVKLANGKSIQVQHKYKFTVVGPDTKSMYNTSYCQSQAEAEYKFDQLLSKYEAVSKPVKGAVR
ncbi:MAG: hypothetical protein JNL36_07750 [Candidatus Kapabacteria bacterium]|nr:hypothetical protein [Candidatus Kapabacteria bacterium]